LVFLWQFLNFVYENYSCSWICKEFVNYSSDPFSLADEDRLRNSLLEIGFKDVHTEHLNTVFEFNSAEDYTQFQKEIAAPVIAMLASETKSRQDEIWNRVTDAAKKYSDNRGHIKLSNEAICIVGRK
jgi:enediyne biosynthesis protein CalE5